MKFFYILFFCILGLHSIPADNLRISGIQLRIDEKMYFTEAGFQKRISSLVTRAMRLYKPDIIVFPEYTGAFLAFMSHNYPIYRSNGYLEFLFKLQKKGYSLEKIFREGSERARRTMDRIFGNLARKNRVWIIAGTYFALENNDLRNRALVYDPKGRIVYRQDKVYLTSSEENVLGLTPGTLREAGSFTVKNIRIGLSICRDTFFSEWENIHKDIDLWIDIKGNGTAYTEEVRREFRKALPGRLKNTAVPYGLTLCLIGKFLDIPFEGEGFFLKNEGESVQYIQKSKTFDQEEILFMNISFPEI